MKQNATSERRQICLQFPNTFWRLLLRHVFEINISLENRFNCFLREELFLFCLLLKSFSPVFTQTKSVLLTFFIFQTKFWNAFLSHNFWIVKMRVKEESYFLSAGIGFNMVFCSVLGCFIFYGKKFFTKMG